MSFSVAIIGAGMAGLSAAQTLHGAGHYVRLFDKSRGSGGRLSSRRSEAGSLDLGAQYFTAHSPDFQRQVLHWQARGWIETWSPALYSFSNGQLSPSPDSETRWVGTPRMSALPKALLGSLPINFSCRITQLCRHQQQWLLHDDAGNSHGPFSHVVLAIPPLQATTLLSTEPDLSGTIATAAMQPTWAVALAFERPLQTLVEACFVHDNAVSWVARNSSKPGRDSTLDSWILHASEAWTGEHLELPAAVVIERLTSAFAAIVDCPLPKPALTQAHRWLYARPAKGQDWGALNDAGHSLYLCGDWCLSGRVEEAWLSGQVAAQHLLEHAALSDTQ